MCPGPPPVAAIDHVLVDADCAVHSFDVLPMPGSDHRALVAEIVLPRETPLDPQRALELFNPELARRESEQRTGG